MKKKKWKSWGDYPPAVIVGVVAGLVGIVSGLISIFQFIKTTQPDVKLTQPDIVSPPPVKSSSPTQEKPLQNVQSMEPIQPDIVSPLSVKSSSPIQEKSPQNVQSMGWIRIGAINHELTSLKDGLPLIATTTQPVTVSPSVVPKIGDKIITKTEVNLRKRPPASPDYDPDKQERLSAFKNPTKLIVLDKKTFIDPKNSSVTVIWAEVSSNEK